LHIQKTHHQLFGSQSKDGRIKKGNIHSVLHFSALSLAQLAPANLPC
jgi:hypothetical protein